MDTAATIKRLRRANNMSLYDLQDKTGIHYTWLSRIENGRAIPTSEQLDKIKAALNWPSDEAVEAAFQLLQGEPAQ